MKPVSTILAVALGLLCEGLPAMAQQDTAGFDLTLRIRSTTPGREVRFRAAFVVDDQRGLQYLEGTTPYEVQGRTRGATAIVEGIAGAAEVSAQLVRGTGTDTLTVSASSGPRLVLEYEPPPAWMTRLLARAQERQVTEAQLAAAVREHQAELAADTSAGLWLITKPDGTVDGSGILSPFPLGASSEDINKTLPALRDREVSSFGFRWSRSVQLGRTIRFLCAQLR